MPTESTELTPELAFERANQAIQTGPLAQLGIVLDSPDEVRTRLSMALVEATTVEDILAERSTESWGDHEGQSYLIKDAHYAPSTKKGGLGFFVIVDAIDLEQDKPVILTSGSENVVLQVAKLKHLGNLDVPVKLVANATADGNTIHRLVKGDVGVKPPF